MNQTDLELTAYFHLVFPSHTWEQPRPDVTMIFMIVKQAVEKHLDQPYSAATDLDAGEFLPVQAELVLGALQHYYEVRAGSSIVHAVNKDFCKGFLLVHETPKIFTELSTNAVSEDERAPITNIMENKLHDGTEVVTL